MKVEVVYAQPQGARCVTLELAAGATLHDALVASGLDFEGRPVGIYGKRLPLDHPLSNGDRVEIYRPLAMDPKEARRRRAAKKR